MTDKEIIIDGCEFQSDCIEYKDISYLKIMPICAIHELSIACHDKVNKCKYYTLYKQLKAKEQENKRLKEDEKSLLNIIDDLQKEKNKWVEKYNDLGQDFDQLKHKEQELQAQRNFTAQEQRKIYCVAYDKTCETGNECKQKKCVFKDRLKFKQALDEIEYQITELFLGVEDKDRTYCEKILDIINKARRDNYGSTNIL